MIARIVARIVVLLLVLAPTSALSNDVVVTRLVDGTKRFAYQRPIVVIGRRCWPMARYVLSRSRLEYERTDLVRRQKALMNQIVDAVRHRPF